jgi:hypothetical protein
MQTKHELHESLMFRALFIVIISLSIAGCSGGGASNSAGPDPSTTSTSTNSTNYAAITPAQISAYTDAQIVALGINIRYLSNAALGALTNTTGAGKPAGLIQSITSDEIGALSPAQVRYIGASLPDGTFGTSQISYLNSDAWTALGGNSTQVAAITAAEIPTLWDSEIAAMGTNISYLSNAALGALTNTTGVGKTVGLIQYISAAQIAALSPTQISIIAGTYSNAGISYLNTAAFANLSQSQIAVLTTSQKASLSTAQHTACGC